MEENYWLNFSIPAELVDDIDLELFDLSGGPIDDYGVQDDHIELEACGTQANLLKFAAWLHHETGDAWESFNEEDVIDAMTLAA